MARNKVFTAPKAFIKIDNEVAGYCRNLSFSENVQRANVQGLGSLTYQEAPAVAYTCQWSVSQYFLSFDTPVMKKMLRKYGSISEIKNTLIMGDISFDITVYSKTVVSEDEQAKLVTEVDNTGQTIARLQGCLLNACSFQVQEAGLAGVDVNGIYLEPITIAG